jgi:mono/diheme cytochrome c family protein
MLNANRRAHFAVSLLLFFAVSGFAFSMFDSNPPVNKDPSPFPSVISPISGHDMYAAYCAGCHGKDGRGFGRYSSECTVPPTDLTQLARKNRGIFPSERVRRVLRHGTGLPPTGQGYMPIWGPLLKLLNGDPPGVTEVRIRGLTEYLKAMQYKSTVAHNGPAPVK